MGKKGKKAQAGKPKKLTPKDVGKRLDVLVKKLEEELEGADLFAPLPPTEDCPICFVPLSRVATYSDYHACCGNSVCTACVMENKKSIKKQNEEKSTGKKLALTCPFCRKPEPTTGPEQLRELQARSLKNDHQAFTAMGDRYQRGKRGTPKDDLKALDCYIRAVELGSPQACTCIGNSYDEGNGVAISKERAAFFDQMGALRGDIVGRHNVGRSEYYSGNYEVGIRHWKLAAEGGSQPSIDALKIVYNNADGKMPGKEFISKERMDSIYRVCHDAQEEVKSEERKKYSRIVVKRAGNKHDMKC